MRIHTAQRAPGGAPLNFDTMDSVGMPFLGDIPGISRAEVAQETVRIPVPGYGVFSTADPLERHCGRTYLDVIELVLQNNAKIQTYSEHWHVDPQTGKATMLLYISWVEWYTTGRADAPVLAERLAAQRRQDITSENPVVKETSSGPNAQSSSPRNRYPLPPRPQR